MFQETDVNKLTRLLCENHIAYFAIGDEVRYKETWPI